jgi:hypothetical protein
MSKFEVSPVQEEHNLLEKVTLRYELFQSISYRLGESRLRSILFKNVAERYARYGSSLLKQKFETQVTLAITAPEVTLKRFIQTVLSASNNFNEMLSLISLSTPAYQQNQQKYANALSLRLVLAMESDPWYLCN